MSKNDKRNAKRAKQMAKYFGRVIPKSEEYFYRRVMTGRVSMIKGPNQIVRLAPEHLSCLAANGSVNVAQEAA